MTVWLLGSLIAAALLPHSIEPRIKDLREAIEQGDLGKVRAILEARPGFVSTMDEEGNSPLGYALAEGRSEVAELLWDIGTKDDVFAAAALGRLEALKGLLASQPVLLSAQGRHRRTPLHWAADWGKAEVVAYLLEKGAAQLPDDQAIVPLHLAARGGHERCVQLLLDGGADIESRDDHGWTPLFYAVSRSRLPIVEMLLERGATPRAEVPSSRYTVLHAAASQGSEEVTAKLLKAGADPGALDMTGCSPLRWAMERGKPGAAKALLAAGARHDVFTAAGLGDDQALARIITLDPASVTARAPDLTDARTPLHWAARWGHREAVRMLIWRRAQVDAADVDGRTPLHLAAIGGHGAVANILVKYGAKMDIVDTVNQRTPLCYAAAAGKEEVVEALLAMGASLEVWDIGGDSPLHLAAKKGHPGTCRLLLAGGARLEAENIFHRDRPLHMAVEGGSAAVVQLLLEMGAAVNARDKEGDTPLHLAASSGKREFVAFLCDRGADINARNATRETPLAAAARCGHKDIVQTLAARGADYDIRSALRVRDIARSKDLLDKHPALVRAGNADGATLLHLATEAGWEEGCELLIARGANVRAADKNGETALHRAASLGRLRIAEVLIDHGADVNAIAEGPWLLAEDSRPGWAPTTGYQGLRFRARPFDSEQSQWPYWDTPLHRAARKGDLKMVQLLVARGADVNARAEGGVSPLTLALKAPSREVAEFLRQHGATE